MTGGIRFRLYVYAAVIALPLAYIGFIGIRATWEANRRQLEDSISRQAQISGVAFEQWLEAQREPLITIAAYVDEQRAFGPGFHRMLDLTVNTRSHWVGLRIVDNTGQVLLLKPSSPPEVSAATIDTLLSKTSEKGWGIATDWSQGNLRGILLLSVPTKAGGAVIAQLDIVTMSGFFLKKVKLSEQSVMSILGPQKRIILYHNPTPETYLGSDLSQSPFYSAMGNKSNGVLELESPIDGISRVYGFATAGETGCVALVGLPSDTLYSPAREQLNRYITLSVAGLLLAIAGAVAIARGIAHPIRWLTTAARGFGGGDLSKRANFRAQGELEDLRKSFNSMAALIEARETRLLELDRLKSDFVSGVSHEMRTPLTTIKTLARVLRSGKVTDSEREEFLETINAECDRQIDLVLNLLTSRE